MMRRAVVATVFSVMILGVMVSSALALDCHGRRIVVGQTPWEVRERCGEPDQIQHVTTYIPQRGYDHRITGYCALAACADLAGTMPAAAERLSDHCPVLVEIQDRDLD
jgi:hypothetical protein